MLRFDAFAAKEKGDNKQDNKNKKQDFGNVCSTSGNAKETEDAGDDGDH
ncbi:MAG TPA: hypothetical protein VKR53_05655 [Puia sp.]|nr:hypothetical protein [Puia sp.]